MPRLLAALLTLACLAAPAAAQDRIPDDKQLARDAAKILEQLPAAQRKALITRLRGLSPDKRRAVLRELVSRHRDKLDAPPIGDELKKLWKILPPEQRQKMLSEAMKELQKLSPEERAEVLKQYAKLQKELNGDKPNKPEKQATSKGSGKKGDPRADAPTDGGPLRRVLRALDGVIERNGQTLDETLQQVTELSRQAREYLEVYRSMPREQREEILRELEDGLKIFIEENVLPELDARIEGLREARENLSKLSAMLREYSEAFRGLPPEERELLIRDLLDAGKLFFEESIKPELERQAKELQKKVEAFRKLPRAERRKRMREMMRRVLGRD